MDLLLDESATSLMADLSVEEMFCVLKDHNTPDENEMICKEVHDDNTRGI